jgi:hypothetical protein
MKSATEINNSGELAQANVIDNSYTHMPPPGAESMDPDDMEPWTKEQQYL